jgi:SAM-dependent methyltransferase
VSERPAERADRDAFARRWRERFEEFAELRDDDAGIAGWSTGGLQTRFRGFRRLFAAPAPGSRWLDVGCGAGTYSAWLAAGGAEVTGLDYSLSTLAKARSRLPGAIVLCAGDATRLPFADATFDGALCFGVLQAVSASAGVVREIARVLRPGAPLWIDALNGAALHARWREWRRRAAGKPPHLRYESARVLYEAMRDAGLVQVRRHWLPIAPGSLHRLQPWLETGVVRAALALPGLGACCAHSVLFHATKAPATVAA